MGRRRNSNLLEELSESPWWLSVLLACFSFVALRYVVPFLWAKNPFVPLSRGLAGYVAVILLLIALWSLLRRWQQRSLLDRQTGIHSIRAMTWQQFEDLVGEAYRRAGYGVRHTGQAGPDGGVDLVIEKDGAWLVQCKHWKNYRVCVKDARELFGLVHAEHAQGGILVTCGTFTPEARDFAEGKSLRLIDGPALLRLIQQVRPATEPHPGAPSSPSPTAPPRCPSCGKPMALRTAKRGPSAGRQFWGCSGYPTCRATVDL